MTVKSNDFAKNVMKITNKPAVHTVPVEKAIEAMQEEVERLKNELQKFNEDHFHHRYVPHLLSLTERK